MLRVPTVGAQDDFFALGGHSLHGHAGGAPPNPRCLRTWRLPVQRPLRGVHTLRKASPRASCSPRSDRRAGRARELARVRARPRTDTRVSPLLRPAADVAPGPTAPLCPRQHPRGAADPRRPERGGPGAAFEALVHSARSRCGTTQFAQHEACLCITSTPPAPFHLPCTDTDGRREPGSRSATARRGRGRASLRPR
ncbi:hypothetical protein, partial [Corallococcus sp. bb12-1]|uniref:hypothetical protein n=1 Tax=Corallococcus sp. bb12-1 TaxID=2996784 RepID=UPI003B63C81C